MKSVNVEALEKDISALMAERIKRLNEVVQSKHLTYVELEKLTGVSKSSIQRYLTGQTEKIPIDFFEKVARVTDTPIDYLTCFDKKIASADSRDDLVDLINQMPKPQYQKLRAFLETMFSE